MNFNFFRNAWFGTGKGEGEVGRPDSSIASEKRCHYEVMELAGDCSTDEIRSAYRKLALLLHPDKLVRSGLTQDEATAKFQRLQKAYEVLSDPVKRAAYDSTRSNVVFFVPSSPSSSEPSVPDLTPFFSSTAYSGYSATGRGFYVVYSDIFGRIFLNEINFRERLGLELEMEEAPVMGDLESSCEQVSAFYNYWAGFSTVMDFCWLDQHDVMEASDRQLRRKMEEENKKLRKKGRSQYNETVKRLVAFVRKKDKRMIDMLAKKNVEIEKKREEERERRKKMEKDKMDSAMAFEEQEWTRLNEEELEEMEEPAKGEKESDMKQELHCVLCRKNFKSVKQWKNHEQSRKHRENVAKYGDSIGEDTDEEDDDDIGEGVEDGNAKLDHEVEELDEMFRASFGIREEINGVLEQSDDDDIFFDARDEDETVEKLVKEDGNGDEDVDDIDESLLLQAMASDHNRRKHKPKIQHSMENNKVDEPIVDAIKQTENNKEFHDKLGKERKHFNQKIQTKSTRESDSNVKSKSKVKKSKTTQKKYGNACQTCGQEFESRNKLHKHLGDTGHAKQKF